MRVSCLICTDLFDEFCNIVACPCGHVFHENCLSEWLAQSKTCPECRSNVTLRSLIKLFFNSTSNDTQDTNLLENELYTLKAKVSAKDVALCKIRSEKAELLAHARKIEDKASEDHVQILKLQADNTKLQLKIKNLSKLQVKIDELENTNTVLHNKLQHFQNVQSVISGTQKDLDDMLQSFSNGPDAIKHLATYCSLLKRELSNITESKQNLRNEITSLKRNISVLNVTNKKHVDKIKQLEEQTQVLEKENVKLIKKQRCGCQTSWTPVPDINPIPGKMRKLASCNDDDSVTPVRDRVFIQPLIKAKVQVSSYEKTVTLSSNIGQSAALRSISNIEFKPIDSSSIIRNGYNGLGGHSNFISRTHCKNFKPPHKRK